MQRGLREFEEYSKAYPEPAAEFDRVVNEQD